jgi:hypothetical protein
LPWAANLARDPRIVDHVEDLIGPDTLIYTSTPIDPSDTDLKFERYCTAQREHGVSRRYWRPALQASTSGC